jgi:hypothetical protein
VRISNRRRRVLIVAIGDLNLISIDDESSPSPLVAVLDQPSASGMFRGGETERFKPKATGPALNTGLPLLLRLCNVRAVPAAVMPSFEKQPTGYASGDEGRVRAC